MRFSLSLVSLSLLWLAACGRPEEAQLKAENAAVGSVQGVDTEKAPCSLSYERGADGTLSDLKVEATFVVDYKIPMPGSGLYGVYRWPGSFTLAKNAREGLKLKRSFLGDADVITGKGEPLFWSAGMHDHKFVVKPSLANPQTLSYEAKEKVGGVLTTVELSLNCQFAR